MRFPIWPKWFRMNLKKELREGWLRSWLRGAGQEWLKSSCQALSWWHPVGDTGDILCLRAEQPQLLQHLQHPGLGGKPHCSPAPEIWGTLGDAQSNHWRLHKGNQPWRVGCGFLMLGSVRALDGNNTKLMFHCFTPSPQHFIDSPGLSKFSL